MSPDEPAREKLDATVPDACAGIEVLVNGDVHAVAGDATLASVIAQLGLAGRRVAVARNQRVVPRSSYDQPLENGDRLEILEAVGGG